MGAGVSLVASALSISVNYMAKSNRKDDCWKCQGKGLIPPKMRDKHIKGAGAIHYTQHDFVDCDACGGTGNI